MNAQRILDAPQTWILIFDTDEEVTEQLLAFAREHRPGCASFTGIGAFRQVTLGYFDWPSKRYLENPVEEQVEVLSLAGNLTWSKDEPKLHAHVVLGTRDGSARGGHLLKAFVRPTLELTLVESPKHLERRHDPASNLPLVAVD